MVGTIVMALKPYFSGLWSSPSHRFADQQLGRDDVDPRLRGADLLGVVDLGRHILHRQTASVGAQLAVSVPFDADRPTSDEGEREEDDGKEEADADTERRRRFMTAENGPHTEGG